MAYDPHPPGTYYIVLTYATIGLEVGQNKCIQRAPPIAKWTIGKNIKDLLWYWSRRKELIEWHILGDQQEFPPGTLA